MKLVLKLEETEVSGLYADGPSVILLIFINVTACLMDVPGTLTSADALA